MRRSRYDVGMVRTLVSLSVGAILLASGSPRAQGSIHEPFDRILDTYVRDGYVYYRALKTERAALDRYVASLDVSRARIDGWSRDDQAAFWVNAYNALVLRTVINAYPIEGRSSEFPSNSIRQIPGAFDGVKHRVGGELLTLDELDRHVIAGFGDARLVLALGRGAIGSPRLHSEAYESARLEQQLARVIEECATRFHCVRVDVPNRVLEVTPIVSWREQVFIETYAAQGEPRWTSRTPLERAVAAMAYPHLFSSEREFLDANTFRMEYGTFDWRLNDLTGGLPN